MLTGNSKSKKTKPPPSNPYQEVVDKIYQTRKPSKSLERSLLQDVSEYVGNFSHPTYGTISVTEVDSATLQFTWGTLVCTSIEQFGDAFIVICIVPSELDPFEFVYYYNRDENGNLIYLISILAGDDASVYFTSPAVGPQYWNFPRVLPVEIEFSVV